MRFSPNVGSVVIPTTIVSVKFKNIFGLKKKERRTASEIYERVVDWTKFLTFFLKFYAFYVAAIHTHTHTFLPRRLIIIIRTLFNKQLDWKKKKKNDRLQRYYMKPLPQLSWKFRIIFLCCERRISKTFSVYSCVYNIAVAASSRGPAYPTTHGFSYSRVL